MLVVEDDLQLSRILRRQIGAYSKLGRPRFDVSATTDISEAVSRAQKGEIDIFVVDLGLEDPEIPGRVSVNVGLKYLPIISQFPCAGIIVLSSEDRDLYFEQTIESGVDDYIQKTDPYEFVIKKIAALWRRSVSVKADALQFESGFRRKFKIGKWKYSIGTQTLTSSDGENLHIGITEHEFLKCMCLAQDMELGEAEIGAFVFKRIDFDNVDLRKSIENLIYRLRKKLHRDAIKYVGSGKYKLFTTEIFQNPEAN